jgi:plastocyanin
MIKRLIIIFILTMFLNPVIASDNQIKNVNYRVLVDQKNGFYKVYEIDNGTFKNPDYQNNTLNISKGDTITWSNEAYVDYQLTIMSIPNLWDNSGLMKYNDKKFSYTFNESGIFDIYINEFPKFRQKIVVGSLEINKTIEKSQTNDINVENNLTKNQIQNQTFLQDLNNTNSNNTNNSNATKATDMANNISFKKSDIRSSPFTIIVLIIVLISVIILVGRMKDGGKK